jgi:hypothetical protein
MLKNPRAMVQMNDALSISKVDGSLYEVVFVESLAGRNCLAKYGLTRRRVEETTLFWTPTKSIDTTSCISPEIIVDKADPVFLLAVELPPHSLLGLSIHVFTVLEIMMVV